MSASASARRAFCSTITIDDPERRGSRASFSKTRSIAIGERPADGSSRRSSRGRATSARASATSFRWPPESEPARWRLRSASSGNTSSTRAISARRSARGSTSAPTCRFSAMRQAREDVLHLRDEVHAAPREQVGTLSRHVDALEADRAAARAHESVDGLEQGRLPRAVRPDDRDDLLCVGVEVDAAQDERVVVAGLEPVHLEERRGQCAVPEVGIDDVLDSSVPRPASRR